jgi:hypothetical protein
MDKNKLTHKSLSLQKKLFGMLSDHLMVDAIDRNHIENQCLREIFNLIAIPTNILTYG